MLSIILSMFFGVLFKTGGHCADFIFVYHISFKALERFYKFDTLRAHGKCRGGISVGFVDVGTNDRKAYDLIYRPIIISWIVDVQTADIGSRGSNTFVIHVDHFYIFYFIEWVFYTDR